MEQQIQPKFSVIVPVYNVAAYLSQCVGSVLSQRASLECILVDDGSTDQSPAMCDAFAECDARVRVIHQDNRGLAGARITGMNAARGEWLLFLDSDDYWPEAMLEHLEADMQKDPGFDLYIGRYLELDESTGSIAPPSEVHLVPGAFQSESYAERVRRFYDSAHWSVWKLVLRREFASAHGIQFLQPVIYAEDMPFDLELLRHARRMCFVETVMVIYRANRRGSLMNVNTPKHFQGILASYRHFDALRSTLSPEEEAEIFTRLANSFWPDVRGASAQSKAVRRACAPLILQLKPLWKLGSQCRGRLDWSLYRILLCVFGPRTALALGSIVQKRKK